MIAALTLSLFLAPPPASDSSVLTLEVGKRTRTAVVFAPAQQRRGGAPLVIAFHGHGGSGADFAAQSELAAAWPEAYVIFPDGLNTPNLGSDPEGEKSGWQRDAGGENDRDLKFFDAILEHFAFARKGRFQKVYVVGFSNGARLSYVLWSARSKDIAAVAVSGTGCLTNQLCQSLPAKPAVVIIGSADTRFDYPHAVKSAEGVLLANKSKVGLSRREPTTAVQVGPTEAGTGILAGLKGPAGFYPASFGGADTLVIVHPEGHSWRKEYDPQVVKFFKEH